MADGNDGTPDGSANDISNLNAQQVAVNSEEIELEVDREAAKTLDAQTRTPSIIGESGDKVWVAGTLGIIGDALKEQSVVKEGEAEHPALDQRVNAIKALLVEGAAKKAVEGERFSKKFKRLTDTHAGNVIETKGSGFDKEKK